MLKIEFLSHILELQQIPLPRENPGQFQKICGKPR
jgi:hypothetical protein